MFLIVNLKKFILTPEEKECKWTLWGKHSFRRFNETSSAYLHESYKIVTPHPLVGGDKKKFSLISDVIFSEFRFGSGKIPTHKNDKNARFATFLQNLVL